jgi:hypothetical protein
MITLEKFPRIKPVHWFDSDTEEGVGSHWLLFTDLCSLPYPSSRNIAWGIRRR